MHYTLIGTFSLTLKCFGVLVDYFIPTQTSYRLCDYFRAYRYHFFYFRIDEAER